MVIQNGSANPLERAAAVFKQYDIRGQNRLTRQEVMAALSELGFLQKATGQKLSSVLGDDMSATYSSDDFVKVCEKLLGLEKVKYELGSGVLPQGADSNPILRNCFVLYCRYNGGLNKVLPPEAGEPLMTGLQFMKLVQDLELLEPTGPVAVSTVDAVFGRAREIGGRRLHFNSFLQALVILSDETRFDVFSVINETTAPGIKPVRPPTMKKQLSTGRSKNLPPLDDSRSNSRQSSMSRDDGRGVSADGQGGLPEWYAGVVEMVRHLKHKVIALEEKGPADGKSVADLTNADRVAALEHKVAELQSKALSSASQPMHSNELSVLMQRLTTVENKCNTQGMELEQANRRLEETQTKLKTTEDALRGATAAVAAANANNASKADAVGMDALKAQVGMLDKQMAETDEKFAGVRGKLTETQAMYNNLATAVGMLRGLEHTKDRLAQIEQQVFGNNMNGNGMAGGVSTGEMEGLRHTMMAMQEQKEGDSVRMAVIEDELRLQAAAIREMHAAGMLEARLGALEAAVASGGGVGGFMQLQGQVAELGNFVNQLAADRDALGAAMAGISREVNTKSRAGPDPHDMAARIMALESRDPGAEVREAKTFLMEQQKLMTEDMQTIKLNMMMLANNVDTAIAKLKGQVDMVVKAAKEGGMDKLSGSLAAILQEPVSIMRSSKAAGEDAPKGNYAPMEALLDLERSLRATQDSTRRDLEQLDAAISQITEWCRVQERSNNEGNEIKEKVLMKLARQIELISQRTGFSAPTTPVRFA